MGNKSLLKDKGFFLDSVICIACKQLGWTEAYALEKFFAFNDTMADLGTPKRTSMRKIKFEIFFFSQKHILKKSVSRS